MTIPTPTDSHQWPGRPSGPFTLYLLWSETELLYVGQTKNLSQRLRAHRNGKTWWPDVRQVETHGYADRRSVLAAECALIDHLAPAHNRPCTDAQRQQFLTGWADPGPSWREERWLAEHAGIPRQRKLAVAHVRDMEDTTLSVAARLLLVWLASWEEAYPAIDGICDALGLSWHEAGAALDELICAGHLDTGEVHR